MTCPDNGPLPTGYRVWQGPVPMPLTQWAMDLRDHINGFPYGYTWAIDYNGQSVIARKDYHSWTYKNGELKTGICIPGITLYQPRPDAPAVKAYGIGEASTQPWQDIAPIDAFTPDPNLGLFGADDVATSTADGPSLAQVAVVAAATAIGSTLGGIPGAMAGAVLGTALGRKATDKLQALVQRLTQG